MLAEIERFVNWQRRRNPDARTWRDYSYDLKQFAACVGDVEPGSVTFQNIDRFVIAQAERGHKPCTINRRLAAITSLYAFLSDEDADLVCPVWPPDALQLVPGSGGSTGVCGTKDPPGTRTQRGSVH
jgi:site-specific recombinase XerD